MRVLIDPTVSLDHRARIQAAAPQVDLVAPADAAQRQAALPGVEGCIATFPSDDEIRAMPKLRWIQTRGQGVQDSPFDLLRERGIVLTNGRACGGPAVAETMMGHLYALSIGLHACAENRRAHRRVFDEWNLRKTELGGATLLQIGLGDIGSRVAAAASAIGMTVLGVRRRPLPPPPGVIEMIPRDRLREGMARADYVAMALPLTPETVGFIGEPELRAMRKSACIVNAGRGKTLQRAPIMRALQEGWIAGAGLDVTDPDPLPPEDPFWDLPNLILTQHLGGSSLLLEGRLCALYAENLRRFAGGEALLNVIDLVARY